MQDYRAKEYLETLTNIAVLVAAGAVLTALSWGYFTVSRAPSLQSGLQKGKVLAKLPNIDYRSSPQTLLVVMNVTCNFCTESIPFYNQLAKLNNDGKNRTRLLAVFPNNEIEVNEYARQNQLQLDSAAAVDLGSISVNGTPTLILVNEEGKILDFWIGAIPKNIENRVIESIKL